MIIDITQLPPESQPCSCAWRNLKPRLQMNLGNIFSFPASVVKEDRLERGSSRCWVNIREFMDKYIPKGLSSIIIIMLQAKTSSYVNWKLFWAALLQGLFCFYITECPQQGKIKPSGRRGDSHPFLPVWASEPFLFLNFLLKYSCVTTLQINSNQKFKK